MSAVTDHRAWDHGSLLRRIAGAFPPVVWAVTATYLVVLLAYSVLFPAYRGPDEPLHVDLAQQVSDDLRYPVWDRGRLDPGIRASLRWADFSERPFEFEADDAPDWSDRPSYAELRQGAAGGGRNQLPQHPPLHYAVAGGADRLVDAVLPGDPLYAYDLQAWFYRLVSVLLVAPLPLVIWRLVRLLHVPEPVGLAATLVPLAVPQLAHIGAVANNDALLMLLVWLLTPVVLRLAQGRLSPHTGALAGALTGLAMLAKGLALVLPLWVALALVVGWWRSERRSRTLALTAAAYGLTALATGGWWWVRNLVAWGQLAPSIEYDRFPEREGVETDFWSFLQAWGYHTNRRFWGEFGWLELRLPMAAIVVASAVSLAALVLAFRRRPYGVDAASRGLLLAPLVLLALFVAVNAYSLYARSGARPLMQGRYAFGALAGAAVLIAIGLAAPLGRQARWLPLLVAALAIAMQSVAVHTIFHFYWGEPGDGFGDRFAGLVAWSPLAAPAVTVGAVIAVVVIAATVVLIVRRSLEESVPAPPVEPSFHLQPAGAAST